MALDPRIILGIRPLETVAEMGDKRRVRDIAEQEVELRRQEIALRGQALRDAAERRNQPAAYDPQKAKQDIEYRTLQAETVAHLLQRAKADPTKYRAVRQSIGQIAGPEAMAHLPEDYDDDFVTGTIADGLAHIKEAKTEAEKLVPIDTVNAEGKPVRRYDTPTAGQEFPIYEKPAAASSGGNPNMEVLALRAAAGDKEAARALQLLKPQGAGPADPLVDVYDPVTKTRVLKRRSQAEGQIPGAAAPGGAGDIKLSAAQQEDIATMMTVSDLIDASKTLGDQIGWKGVGGMFKGSASRFGAKNFGAGTPEEEALRENIGNIQGTIAKLRGGTAFSAQEKKMLDTYTPTIDDDPKMLQSKFSNLKNFIALKQANTIKVARGDFSTTAPAPPPPAAKAAPAGVERWERGPDGKLRKAAN